MVEYIVIDILVLIALACVVRFCMVIGKGPHVHHFRTYHPGMCQYGQCLCGAGIDLQEAARDGIPVYWRDSGNLVVWDETYLRNLRTKKNGK